MRHVGAAIGSQFRVVQAEDGMAFERTAEWDFDARDKRRFAQNEETVRRGFWTKFKRVAAKLPFAEDLLTAYYCAFDRDTPLQVKAALIGGLPISSCRSISFPTCCR
jgi:hypothetical protein